MICPPDHKHAETSTCYTTHGCKCEPCMEGRRVAGRELRADRAPERVECERCGITIPRVRRLCGDCREFRAAEQRRTKYVDPVTVRLALDIAMGRA